MDNYDCHEWDVEGWPGEFLFGDDIYLDDYYMDERWKPIPRFENNYWISNKTRVWSIKTRSFLKVKPMDKHGHLGVCLCKDGERYYRYIHRLMAEAFIPNPHRYPVVRHLDDNPDYNTIENLRWGTQRDNAYDAIRNGRAYLITDEDREKGCQLKRTPIMAVNLRTGEEIIFNGQGTAARILDIPQANIWKVLNGLRPRAQGYVFRYLDKENEEYEF